MGKILVIAEKPSLGRSIAGAISWWKGEKFERQGKDRNTWLESDNYIVVSLVGHLYELIDFDAYFPGYDPAVKQPWDLKKLPFFPDDWKFKFEGKEKVQGLIKVANQQMNRKDVDAIYNAGDPDREGQRLVDEVLLYGLKAPRRFIGSGFLILRTRPLSRHSRQPSPMPDTYPCLLLLRRAVRLIGCSALN